MVLCWTLYIYKWIQFCLIVFQFIYDKEEIEVHSCVVSKYPARKNLYMCLHLVNEDLELLFEQLR